MGTFQQKQDHHKGWKHSPKEMPHQFQGPTSMFLRTRMKSINICIAIRVQISHLIGKCMLRMIELLKKMIHFTSRSRDGDLKKKKKNTSWTPMNLMGHFFLVLSKTFLSVGYIIRDECNKASFTEV